MMKFCHISWLEADTQAENTRYRASFKGVHSDQSGVEGGLPDAGNYEEGAPVKEMWALLEDVKAGRTRLNSPGNNGVNRS